MERHVRCSNSISLCAARSGSLSIVTRFQGKWNPTRLLKRASYRLNTSPDGSSAPVQNIIGAHSVKVFTTNLGALHGCTSVCDQKKASYVLSSRADRSRSCTVASSTLRLASNQRPFCCEAIPLRPRSVAQRPSTLPRGGLVRHRDYCAAPSSWRRKSDNVFRRLRCTKTSTALTSHVWSLSLPM